MNNGILQAIKWFEKTRREAADSILREQAESQSDRDPFLPYRKTKDRSVAPLQGRLNHHVEGGCSCDTVCPTCVEYQMTLNQAH